MSKENQSTQKTELRKALIARRKAISPERRKEAAIQVAKSLIHPGSVLSFSSFGSEIDLSLLNRKLAAENRLFLPRIEENKIAIYRVANCDTDLQISSSGIPEPNPTFCQKSSLFQMDVILVPGLGFDREGNRLGYGKGHYDEFLVSHKSYLIGIGFKEQQVEALPRDSWDLSLDELLLF